MQFINDYTTQIKCAQYWPSTGSCEYGDIRVELTSEMKESDYTIRDFLLTKVNLFLKNKNF